MTWTGQMLVSPVYSCSKASRSLTVQRITPDTALPIPGARTRKHKHMDNSHASLSQLSAELVALICEHLRDIDPSSLRRSRLVSRIFNDSATPLSFRTLVVSERLVTEDALEHCPSSLIHHIRQFTKHLIVPGNLPPVGIKRLLAHMSELSTITWRFESDDLREDGLWLPSDALDLDNMRLHGTELYIENLPMQQHIDSYLTAIPTDALVSLKVAGPTPPLTGRLSALKKLILQSSNLEVLYYQDRGQGKQLHFERGERMPALRELSLRSYDWGHSRREVEEHWDLSQLRSLQLREVPSFNFLRSLPPGALSNVTSLCIDDWSAHLADHRREATSLLNDLVRRGIRSLRSLQATCHIELFPLDAVARHRDLEHLRIRDHVGFSSEDRKCPTLPPRDLAALARYLPKLCTLEVDMDRRRCNPEQFLQALLHFQRLDTLTIHVQTTIRVTDEDLPTGDDDYDAAMEMLSVLTTDREENRPDFPWKQVTINVGGWQRVMVRRLSEAWREYNRRGIYAERCFVMERINMSYIVREVHHEGTSGVVSPNVSSPFR